MEAEISHAGGISMSGLKEEISQTWYWEMQQSTLAMCQSWDRVTAPSQWVFKTSEERCQW